MTIQLAALGTALSPILFVVVLLWLTGWRERMREAATARQIRLTDAIGAELGAIVAPVVRKPLLRPWRVQIAVPFGRPATVGRILAIAHRALERMTGRYEIVLTTQAPAPRAFIRRVTASSRLRVA